MAVAAGNGGARQKGAKVVTNRVGLLLICLSFGYGQPFSIRSTQQFSDSIGPGIAMPKWSGGLLTSWRTDTPASNPSPNLVIADRQGRTVARHRLWVAEASAVKIRDAAAGDSRQLAVVGIATSPTGHYAGYLAIVDPQTKAAKVIQTAPFEGQQVAWGPNESIWILGYQLTAERKLLTAAPHALLRQYDREGKLIAEHLPWPAINCGKHPLLVDWAQITTSPTKIGILLPACQTWIELSPDGRQFGRWQPAFPPGFEPKKMHLGRPVIAKSGTPYLFASTPQIQGADGSLRHVTLFSLTVDHRSWEAIPTDADLWCLAGADAEGLAFCSGASSLTWINR
jgi:hypothetical protein